MTPSQRRRQGRNEYDKDALPEDLCPYRVDSYDGKRDDWMDGWNEAKATEQREEAEDLGSKEDMLDTLKAINVLHEVGLERCRQDDKWGGPEHDDEHTTDDFIGLIEGYAGWARVMGDMHNPEKARKRLIQTAALAVAAVESMDRKAGGG